MTGRGAAGDDAVGADKAEIAEVLMRYATGIDQRDWDLFRTCFTDDVVAAYDAVATWNGVDAITGFMDAAHADMGHTLHRLGNLVIEVEGDTATARAYVDVILMTTGGQEGLNCVGVYDDDLVRTPAGWRIRRRHFTMVRTQRLG